MRAGLLRHFLAIERPVTGLRDDVGQVTEEWQEHAKAWGSLEDLTGQELTDARQVDGRAKVRAVIRYEDAPGVTRAMRILYEGRVMRIVAVADKSGRRRMLELTCAEEV